LPNIENPVPVRIFRKYLTTSYNTQTSIRSRAEGKQQHHQQVNNNNMASTTENIIEIDDREKDPAIEKYMPAVNEARIIKALNIDIKDQVSC
jgi:hypothetical protein